MIFYFSATGNGEYIANKISKVANDNTVSITQAILNRDFTYEIAKDENIGFVIPVYFFGIPTVVLDFIEKVKLTAGGNNYVYSVLNCGGSTANAGKMLEKALKKKNIAVDALFAVRMVDNYIPMFEIADEAKANEILSKAEPFIDKIIEQIANKDKGDFNSIKGPAYMTKVLYPLYKLNAKTKKFYADNNCIACGKCAKECVCEAIEMTNGKPQWVKKECTQCLHCIHSCPVKAIQFGKKSEAKNRYYNPNV